MGCYSGMQMLAGVTMMIAVVSLRVQAVLSSDVIVTTEGVVDVTNNTTMTCSTIDAIDELEWLFSSEEETDSNKATLIFKYESFGSAVTPGSTINATRFEFTGPGGRGDYPLVIKSVEYGDIGKYWCRILTTSFDSKENNLLLNVIGPSSMARSFKIGERSNGEKVNVSTESEQALSCVLYGIRPAATAMWWSVSDGTVAFSNQEINSYPNADESMLFDTNLTAIFSFPESPLAIELSCITPDRQVGVSTGNVSITVTLYVTADPCNPNPCQNGGTCYAKGDSAACHCSGGYGGPLCGTAPTTSPPEPATESDDSTTTSTEEPKGLAVGAIVGIAVGCVAVLVVVCGIVVYYCFKTKTRREHEGDENLGMNKKAADL